MSDKEKLLTILNAVLAINQHVHALDSDVICKLYDVQNELENEIEKGPYVMGLSVLEPDVLTEALNDLKPFNGPRRGGRGC